MSGLTVFSIPNAVAGFWEYGNEGRSGLLNGVANVFKTSELTTLAKISQEKHNIPLEEGLVMAIRGLVAIDRKSDASDEVKAAVSGAVSALGEVLEKNDALKERFETKLAGQQFRERALELLEKSRRPVFGHSTLQSGEPVMR